jgi:hypothetical protein
MTKIGYGSNGDPHNYIGNIHFDANGTPGNYKLISTRDLSVTTHDTRTSPGSNVLYNTGATVNVDGNTIRTGLDGKYYANGSDVALHQGMNYLRNGATVNVQGKNAAITSRLGTTANITNQGDHLDINGETDTRLLSKGNGSELNAAFHNEAHGMSAKAAGDRVSDHLGRYEAGGDGHRGPGWHEHGRQHGRGWHANFWHSWHKRHPDPDLV